MKPDENYIALQKRLEHLIKINDRSRERIIVENQLEKRFMAAWNFGPDRVRLGYKLSEALRVFTTKEGECVRGFDHCTFYSGPNDQRVIVTQPYNSFASEILQDLTFDNGICPEVIDATEWAFYYPGEARLFIVKFPFEFEKEMKNFEKRMKRAELEKALNSRDDESAYFDVSETS